MASSVNRTAIILTIGVFLGFGVFCVITQAPLIQQDILRRCEDALVVRHIPVDGLSVSGRDVILRGRLDSLITSAETQAILQKVSGVRTVQLLVDNGDSPTRSSGLEPAGSDQQRELQAKIDEVLQNQGIAFKADTAVLTPESESALDSVAALLAAVPTLRCEIRGFAASNMATGQTATKPSREQMILALQQALATEDRLVAKGVAEWRLSTHAFQAGDYTDGRRVIRVVDLVVRAR